MRKTRGFVDRNLPAGLGHVTLLKLTTGDIGVLVTRGVWKVETTTLWLTLG